MRLKGSMLIVFLLLAAGNGWDFKEQGCYLDQGFGAGLVTPVAIMVHSTPNLSGLFQSGLAYNYLINESGDRGKWLPKGSNAMPYQYTGLPVAYHGGKGMLPGECQPHNMNLITIGIGLYYPIGGNASNAQLQSLAELATNLTLAYPSNDTFQGIRYIFGQNVSASYRMQNVTLRDEIGQKTNSNGLMFNPWNFDLSKFAVILNTAGQTHNLRWKLMSGSGVYCNTTSGLNESWPIEYLERQK